MKRPARNRSRGGAAVEFALVLPLFLTIVFGVIEYGWFFYQKFGFASAVRDGLRIGATVSQTASPDPQQTAVTRTQALMEGIGISAAGVTLTTTYTGASPSRTMTLNASMNYRPLIGIIPTPNTVRYGMTMLLEMQ